MNALLVLALLVACGGGATGATPTSRAGAAPTATKQPSAQPSGDLQTRISDSLNLTLGVDTMVLPSYHIEISMAEPSWDTETSQVKITNWTLSGDVSGQDMHIIHTSDGTTTEGYIIAGGFAKSEEGGKEYELVNGQLQDSFSLSLTWVVIPLSAGMPLIIAAVGPTAQGEETIDGRVAEKYNVDTANAPSGAMALLGGLLTITSSRGTAWVDKETGALLKMNIDYDQNFTDPQNTSTVMGTGSGHVELLVTKVGQVSVQLPQ
jgi:hypothetical protein